MKIYLAHSTGYNFEAELYKPIQASLSKENDVYYPHQQPNQGTHSKDIITNSDIVLAEVSHPSTGQGIELGWANDHNVPVLCFYRTGVKISHALRFVSDMFIEYSTSQDMSAKLLSALGHYKKD